MSLDLQAPPAPGARIVYHVGHLADDRQHDHDLDVLALRVLTWAGFRRVLYSAEHCERWAETGPSLCHLLQRRLPDGRFEYLAVGCR